MKNKLQLVCIGAALAAVLFAAVLLGRHDSAPATKPRAEPNLFPFVRSLEGTRPDGEIKVTDDDALVVNAELRRMFDYYLSAVGEKTIDEIRAEIEQELDRLLKPAPAKEAKQLLARYLNYKRALLELERDMQLAGASAGAVRSRFTAMQQVRGRYFSAMENQGLFGFDDAYDIDAVTRLEISQNSALNEAQKKEKLAALDAAMSPALRAERDAPLQIVRLEESVAKMRAQGASEDDIYRVRAAALTPEAATRLAAVDQDELAWKSRIAVYLVARANVIGNTALSGADRETALTQLRQAHFSPDEQRRLGAYE